MPATVFSTHLVTRAAVTSAMLAMLFPALPATAATTWTASAISSAVDTPAFADPPVRLGRCQQVRVPVSLPTGQAEHLAGHLCQPAHHRPRTILALVHGGTYNSSYWSWPMDPGFYSFTWQALAAGYAVFAVDRLGAGQSSHPDSTMDTFAAQGYTLHQAIAALRAGTVGHARYRRVILVGHSFGAAEIAQELSVYPRDADAVILTGSGHTVSASTTGLTHTGFAPAATQLSRDIGLDTGYLTSTTQQVRDQLLYRTTDSSPAIRRFDQATRDTLAYTELATRPADLSTLTRSLRIPILLLDGQDDSHYCNEAQTPAETDLDDCSTAAGLYRSEHANYGPCLATAIVPGSGHDLATEYGARIAASTILRYAAVTLPPHGERARCAVTGPLTAAAG
jgi:pimeloyl-ACP methyl ester carboxylesterase